MNSKNLSLFIFWGIAFIVITWSLPFLARENEIFNILLSYCISIIEWQNFKKCKRINKVREGRTHIVDMIKNKDIDLIINTTQNKQAIKDSYLIRREALQQRIYYTTTIAGANALVGAISHSKNLKVYKLQDIFGLA